MSFLWGVHGIFVMVFSVAGGTGLLGGVGGLVAGVGQALESERSRRLLRSVGALLAGAGLEVLLVLRLERSS